MTEEQDTDLYDLGLAQTAAHQAQITLRLAEQKRLERIATDIQLTTLNAIGQVQVQLEKLETEITTLRTEMRDLARRIQEKMDIGFEIMGEESYKKRIALGGMEKSLELLITLTAQVAEYTKRGEVAPMAIVKKLEEAAQAVAA